MFWEFPNFQNLNFNLPNFQNLKSTSQKFRIEFGISECSPGRRGVAGVAGVAGARWRGGRSPAWLEGRGGWGMTSCAGKLTAREHSLPIFSQKILITHIKVLLKWTLYENSDSLVFSWEQNQSYCSHFPQ
jgi:hypothetical protein